MRARVETLAGSAPSGASDGASWRSDAALNAVDRLRLAVVCTAISLMVFAQSSGMVAADTKLDLVVTPVRFLRRALTLWDPVGGSGQLQDQAYGYLFPMGPFFLLGKLSAAPPWVIQRAWESGLLVVAFLGARRLAQLLGVYGWSATVATGLVYALSPRMLTELFSISAELLPVAVLPLVLIPLVRASVAGPVRSGAMRSGAALLLAGGINASATLAILPVPALWLLTRSRGPRKRSLMRWWLLALALSCLWWFVPLLILGRYSPPFLEWIESAAVTTSQNSFIAVARGVDHWQAYLGPSVWPAGWIYAVAPAAIVATSVVAALGFGGLALPRVPHRVFLLSTLLLGLALLTVGHRAGVGSPAAPAVQRLLDNALSAFRNIHKFDPLVRLPMAIGAGHLVAHSARRVAALRSTGTSTSLRSLSPFVSVVALACVAAVALGPALSNRLVALPRSIALPGYWTQAAAWLDNHSAQGRALVLPGAGRPEMFWGATVDEPMQAVAQSPWASRETVPLGQAGYVRMLDELERVVSTGTPQASLAPLLLRAGVAYVVVRADLNPTADATRIGLVRSTVASSAGLSPVRTFGPEMGDTGASNRLIDYGTASRIPAIEIFSVDGAGGPVRMMSTDGAVVANGSSDELSSLVSVGLGPDRPVLFGADGDGVGVSEPIRVMTDGVRKREVQFGHPGAVTATMGAAQPYQTRRKLHDYLPDNVGALSTYVYRGIADVRASSAGSDAAAFLNRSPDHAPWYALDGDSSTSWLSGAADGAVGQWWEIRFESVIKDPVVTIQFPPLGGDAPTSLAVQTDAGVQTVDVTPDDKPQRLSVPVGLTQRLRMTVASVESGTKGTAAGLASVSIAGVHPERQLRIPGEVDADVLAFRAASGYRSGCAAVGTASACLPALARTGEEQAAISRAFTLAKPGDYAVSASVVLTPSQHLDALLDGGSAVQVTASSRASPDPRQRPGAVVDGSAGTTWSAASDDPIPTLTLRWREPIVVSSLILRTSTTAPVSVPATLRVTAGARTWTMRVSDIGSVVLPQPVATNELKIAIVKSMVRVSTDSVTGSAEILPAGISEIEVPGLDAAAETGDVSLPCGEGPTLEMDGRTVETKVDAPRAAALAGQEVNATACGAPVNLVAGEHDLALRATSDLIPTGLQLARDGRLTSTAPAQLTSRIQHWAATERSIRVSTTTQAFLVVHENFNAGWRATLSGHRLAAARVDGWQQAFVVPAGTSGTAQLTFGPQRPFEGGLVIGLAAALVMLGLAIRPSRDGRPAGLRDGHIGPRTVWFAVVVTASVVAGLAGFIVATAMVVLASVDRSGRARRWLPLAAVCCVVIAGVLNAVGPSVSSHQLTDSPLTQLLALAAFLMPAVPLGDESARDSE